MTAVLGTMLMLGLMVTLIPGAIMLRAAVSAEMDAQREAAERAAYCARHPDVGPPTCPEKGPLPGYACTQAEVDVWVCTRRAQGSTTPAPTTPLAAAGPVLAGA